jgi:hypothetical protein
MEHHTFSYFTIDGKLGYILIERSEVRGEDTTILIGRHLDLTGTIALEEEDKFPPELSIA